MSQKYLSAGIVSSDIKSYLSLSIGSSVAKANTILVFPNMEYQITFYDANLSATRSLTGLVLDVWDDQIKLKCRASASGTNSAVCACPTVTTITNAKDCYSVKINNNCNCDRTAFVTSTTTSPMPNCGCVLNPPNVSAYNDLEIVYIPVANITKVTYVKGNNTGLDIAPCNCNGDSVNKYEEEDVRIMLMGISATVLKAIVVRMAFIDDNLEQAIKSVDLEVGNVYNFIYEVDNSCECGCPGTTYEVVGKVTAIEEVNDADIACKNGRGFVRENVGMNNCVYLNCGCNTDKDNFLSGNPVQCIKITIDTSKTFTGRYEVISLDRIRECILIEDLNNSGSDNNGGCECPPPPPPCGCNPPETYCYTFENGSMAKITGNMVTLTTGSGVHELTLEELAKFYLGVE